jgi:hypothetical protein
VAITHTTARAQPAVPMCPVRKTRHNGPTQQDKGALMTRLVRGRNIAVAMLAAIASLAVVAVAVSSATKAKVRAHAAGTTTVSVGGSESWIDSGVALTANEKVTIAVTGTVNVCSPGSCVMKPTGEKLPGKSCLKFQYNGSGEGAREKQPFPAPGLSCYSVIARVGTGPAFPVGAKVAFNSPDAGELSLRMNQNDDEKDSGSFSAMITTP